MSAIASCSTVPVTRSIRWVGKSGGVILGVLLERVETRFAGRTWLEALVLAAGPGLLGGIAAVLVAAIATSYGIGRLLGLPHRMATLIAWGNSICGNSAIAP